MNRNWILALAVAVSAPVGLVGCGETEGTKVTTENKGPGGSTTETVEKKVEVKGDGGAAPATGTTDAPK